MRDILKIFEFTSKNERLLIPLEHHANAERHFLVDARHVSVNALSESPRRVMRNAELSTPSPYCPTRDAELPRDFFLQSAAIYQATK
jgi:hypothetical protein